MLQRQWAFKVRIELESSDQFLYKYMNKDFSNIGKKKFSQYFFNLGFLRLKQKSKLYIELLKILVSLTKLDIDFLV